MDTELLVEDRIADGEKFIAELIRDGFDVTVALWAKTSEEGLWFLYVGSSSVQAGNIGVSYRRAYECLSRVPSASIRLSEIKLVAATNPIAEEAIAVRDRYPARLPTRFQGTRLGNLSIEEAYIYRRDAGPMTSSDVMLAVTTLMNRTGILQPSLVTLRDGTSIRAIPVSIQMRQPGDVQIVFQNVDTNSEQTIAADDVANIE